MADDTLQLSEYEISSIIGEMGFSEAQRNILKGAFQVRRGLRSEEAKDMLLQLVQARLVGEDAARRLHKKLFP